MGAISRFAFCKINTTFKCGLRFWMTVKEIQNARTPKQLYRIRVVIHLALLLSFWWRLETHALKENAYNGQLKDLHIAGFFSLCPPSPSCHKLLVGLLL